MYILLACKKCDLVKEDFSKKKDHISESQVNFFLLSTTRRLSLSCFQAFKFTTTFADQELRLQSDSNLELKTFLPVPFAHNQDRPLYLFKFTSTCIGMWILYHHGLWEDLPKKHSFFWVLPYFLPPPHTFRATFSMFLNDKMSFLCCDNWIILIAEVDPGH